MVELLRLALGVILLREWRSEPNERRDIGDLGMVSRPCSSAIEARARREVFRTVVSAKVLLASGLCFCNRNCSA